MRHPFIFFIVLMSLLFQACSSDDFDADISNINIDLKVKRLDQDFFVTDRPASDINQTLQSEFGSFYREYLENIIRIGAPEDPMIAASIELFKEDPGIQQIQHEISKTYPDFTSEREALEKAFKYYAHYFPQDTIPLIITYNSGFNFGIYPNDSVLGIGLEWYLGSDNPVIQRLPPEMFPQYKRDKMKPEFLPINAVKGWLTVNNQHFLTGDKLLSHIIFHGKIMYALNAMFPDEDLEKLFNYQPEQLVWNRENEYQVWQFLVENQLIFSSDSKEIAKMINDGPFTPGMPVESPGGVGVWLGYRIVENFMDKNPKLSLAELLEISNDQRILKGYKPGR